MPLHVRFTKGLVHFAKFSINMRHMPMVPRKAQISDTSLQGPHLLILLMYLGSGSHPSGVQRCPTAIISSVHKTDFGLLKVPTQYLTHCTMRVTNSFSLSVQ